MKTETTINNDSAKITSDMTREERIATIKASINKKPEITASQEMSPEELKAEEAKRKKEKIEEEKRKKEEAKKEAKLSKDKEAKRKKEKIEIHKALYKNEALLAIFRQKEAKRIKKNILINSIIILIAVAGATAGALLFNILSLVAAAPFLIFNGLKIFKNIREYISFNDPYELQRVLLKRKADEEAKKSDKKIIDEYKSEKKRIKKMKKMPYKILANLSFILSMFTIIFFYFVVGVRLPTVLILLFVVFTISYFLVGIGMTAIAYLISENKIREQKIKADEEKRRLLAEEKIKSEEALYKKLESERRKYEEEKELKIAEEMRISIEMEKERARRQEEQKLFELTSQSKENILEKSRFAKAGLQQKNIIDIESETKEIKNKISSEILDEASKISDYDLGGIENFYKQQNSYDTFEQEVEYPTTSYSEDDKLFFDGFEGALFSNSTNNDYADDSDIFEMNSQKQKTPASDEVKQHATLNKNIPTPVMPPAPSAEERAARGANPKSISLIKEMLKT